ncbi:GDP-mannose 4,6-dehydratase [Photobacterium swingsii]
MNNFNPVSNYCQEIPANEAPKTGWKPLTSFEEVLQDMFG